MPAWPGSRPAALVPSALKSRNTVPDICPVVGKVAAEVGKLNAPLNSRIEPRVTGTFLMVVTFVDPEI